MTCPPQFPVCRFQHPHLPLPPPLMMTEPDSFAHYTYQQRWPGVILRIQREQEWPEPVITALNALGRELTDNAAVRSLHDAQAPDAEAWTTYLAPYLDLSWLDLPWFFAEIYFYRRILEATQYFQPAAFTQGQDPFQSQKQAGLDHAMDAVRAICNVPTQPTLRERLAFLLYVSLWGNQADLSLAPEAAAASHEGIHADLRQGYILVDECGQLCDRLLTLAGERIDIVADNAGLELVSDLCLTDVLLAAGVVNQVYLHLKPSPVLVSDAMVADAVHTIDTLARDRDREVRLLAARLKHYRAMDVLQFAAHPVWSAPLVFWEMIEPLQAELGLTRLTLLKGDANYRRLLGDCHWPPPTPFADIAAYFPTPLAALRTLKSEIVAGLPADSLDSLTEKDPQWMVNGQWGLIQMAG
ncbi:MAG: damage-control phosphatase ARMT1 family protein [Synechococcales bacterium]|nr:damage-control phosphatase ARMT1 family protein [Synechococcales bacterium]